MSYDKTWSILQLTFNVSRDNIRVRNSETRLMDYSSTLGHLHQWSFAQKYTKFAKIGSNFCQIVNEPLKNCLRFWRFWQSGEILPNLVTLVRNDTGGYWSVMNFIPSRDVKSGLPGIKLHSGAHCRALNSIKTF